MEKNITVSVIIPAFNAEKYIQQCIENVTFQSYTNTEIIVVDNGSTDNTASIVKEFAHVQYIYQKNQGLSVARNTGINAASGEYVHFLDADDLLTLDFYEKMVEAVVETQADVSCCGFYFERNPKLSQYIHFKTIATSTEDKIYMTNVGNYAACWRYLFKTSFLKKFNLYFEPNRLAEDRIFTPQAIYFANKVVFVPEAMYLYKHRKGAITTKKEISFVKKRHADRKYANEFQANFAKAHHFILDKTAEEEVIQYKFLGIPLVRKKYYNPCKFRVYFLGIPVYQRKTIGK